LRHQFDIGEGLHKQFLVPRDGGLAVALPEALRVFAEALHQQRKLFGLCAVHALVDRVQDFGCLFDHGEGCSHRRISTALAHLQFRRATDTHASLAHVLHQPHQGLRRLLVRQRHDGVGDLLATSLDLCAAPRRDAEDVGVLAGTDIADQEAGEVGIHASVQQFAPCGGDRVGGVAKDVQQADVIEAQPRHERVLHERCTRLRQHSRLRLVVVAGDGQDFAGGYVDGHAVRDFQTCDLALELVFMALDVQFAVDFVDFAVTVIGVGRRGRDALLRCLGLGGGVRRDLHRGGQFDVAVDAKDLQALDGRRLEVDAVRDPHGGRQVGRGVVDDQVVGIHAVAGRTVPQRAEEHLLERRATEAQQQQHAVGVGVVFAGGRGQEVVHVLFERIGDLIALRGRAVGIVPDLDRTIGRQQFGAGVRLETQHSLLQQRVPDLGHAFDGCAVTSALQPRQFDLETKQLDALCAVFDPLVAALQIVSHTAQEVFGDAGQFGLVDLFGEVVEPPFGLAVNIFGVRDGLAIQRQGDAAIPVVDLHDRAVFVDFRDVPQIVTAVFDLDIHVAHFVGFACPRQADVWVQARHRWSPSR